MATAVDAVGEREEGEIVESTEYEDISSDEEFTLRLRIEELEARNFELEQIANISGLATNPYELSTGRERVGKENLQKFRSRSDEELRTPKKVRRPVTRATHTHPVSRRRRLQKAQKTRKRKKRRLSQSSSENDCKLDRDELRAALNRSIDSRFDVIEVPVEIPVITIDDDEEEDVLKLRLEALQSKQEIKSELQGILPGKEGQGEVEEESEEQELRLIALKSAIVKKHEARKKRKTEEDGPYSPTDDLDCVMVNSPAKADECSMDISPLDSPAIPPENPVVVDMEISNDAPGQEAKLEEENVESEDEMALRNLLLSTVKKPPEPEKPLESPMEVSLEEDCLRSLLLSTMKKSKKEEPSEPQKSPPIPEIVPLERVKKTVERKSQMVTDLPAIKVSPLVISLRESDSDSDEWLADGPETAELEVDNKSPASLVMDSPCDSPASPQVPPPAQSQEAKKGPTKGFQEKLDLFLKQARSTVEKQKVPTPKTQVIKLPKTPLALSHLPASSQLEYRRLVARMNHLERQKKRQLEQKNLPAAKRSSAGSDAADKAILKTSNNIKIVVQNNVEEAKNEAAELTVVMRKDEPLRKKVLMKSAQSIGVRNGIKSPEKGAKRKVPVSNSGPHEEEAVLERLLKRISKMPDQKKHKALEVYEKHFSKTSATFLEGLDSLLVMVKRVQSEKIEQYRLQDELTRLKKQVKLVEDSLAQQKTVVQRLTPKMTFQHKNILKYRNKCVSLNKMCLKLGQIVVGTKYRLPSDTKRKLMEKFQALAVETKRLKEIQVTDGSKVSQDDQGNSNEVTIDENQQNDVTSSEQSLTAGNSQNTYKSPLDHMNSHPTANPDAVVCPFDLMGKCEDSECHYSHLMMHKKPDSKREVSDF
ncbi:LOW QUALITY PROTEIN: neurofilament heavy polypeptide [Phlebotomus papatasi]|uniref:LOW QUALITY PROTEIN: neurofilament heavy polypeptide n=1 Tax=Phlebotomus papatasi TaxID=29031 RepID=UPI002483E67B|nr:LOW QUALITY PROTEIN: neurofilament heavy polypeptide [Phlebotomus papatasi]